MLSQEIGYFTFDFIITDYENNPLFTSIFVVIAVLIALSNPSYFIRKAFKKKYNAQSLNSQKKTFTEATKEFFDNTYESCNPINLIRNRIKLYNSKEFFNLRESSLR
jgi:hypothetical protein